mmetsp:Transcript_23876/g.76929  ORF Transcript_23876/g.76929 Transcript_23876/m.76929 type:complete len:105 (-) Transcript_23876:26-340(-)
MLCYEVWIGRPVTSSCSSGASTPFFPTLLPGCSSEAAYVSSRCRSPTRSRVRRTETDGKALIFVDGAHALGQVHIDLAAFRSAGVHFCVMDGHKWFFVANKGFC